ncbi:hypothetical protein CVT24_002803 [Panaeolus cyanescens]|uniref:Uncharacterized protein n=1 Tax=Panaeolus cyanescens TaxID=181874 RepID=A0A409X204_9AGAR|nr:hypothetical protein CVT24_002803 [Panaeolus cyanescens]
MGLGLTEVRNCSQTYFQALLTIRIPVTHTNDPIPHVPDQTMDYAHHGTEYWISRNSATPDNIVSCIPSGEDDNCANSLPFTPVAFILPAHLVYMNIHVATPYCE